MSKVLVVATSRNTRGGITSVIKSHEKGLQWEKFHCKWIETHQDGSFLLKIWKLITGWIKFIFFLPFYDIVHFHLSEVPSALRKRYFFFPWAKLFRKKIIVHFHAFSPETTIHSKSKNLYNYLFSKSDIVFVLSNFWKDQVLSVFPKVKVEVLYNPCSLDVTLDVNSEIESFDDNFHYILYAGTINARKGYSDLLKAFSQISSQFPKWKLLFAGNGEIESGKILSKQLRIEDQVVWLGWVNGVDKYKAFKSSEIFCLPSYAEGFPMAVLDAWSYGLPVVTTPVGGIPDVAIDGENMLLFTPGDIDYLAFCLSRLIKDSSLRLKIADASKQFFLTTFNIDTINSELANYYTKLSS